jgi:hypothetical protein
LRAEPREKEREREDRDDDDDRERRDRPERVGEIGPREPNPAPKSLTERQALDDDGRHRKAEEGEPAERDEVHPLEHGDPRDGNRPERDDTGEQSRAERSGAPRRHADRADVGRPEDKWPDDDPVAELHATVQERGSDRVRSRGEAKREAAPEPPSVQLDCLGDELADGTVSRVHGGLHKETLSGRRERQRRRRFTR